MSATNESHLNKNAGIIEVVKVPDGFSPLLSDLSNVVAVKTAIDALTLVRMASVVDLQVAENYADQVTVDVDDNKRIYTSAEPSVVVSGAYYETWNPDVLTEVLPKTKVTDVTGEFVGNVIENSDIPAIIIRITSTDPQTGKIKQTYVIDASFTGEMISQYLDPKRAGNLANSPFEYTGNSGGGIFTFTDEGVA